MWIGCKLKIRTFYTRIFYIQEVFIQPPCSIADPSAPDLSYYFAFFDFRRIPKLLFIHIFDYMYHILNIWNDQKDLNIYYENR